MPRRDRPDPSQIVEIPKWKRKRHRYTLAQLYINFPYEVFKYDPIPPQPVKIQRIKISDNKLVMTVWARVKSATKPNTYYSTIIQLYRKDPDIPWSWHNLCTVKCTCDAFHYFLAYPLYITGTLWGKPRLWNKVPNKVRNRAKIPALCKHLVLVTNYLIKRGIIEGRILWHPERYKNGSKGWRRR